MTAILCIFLGAWCARNILMALTREVTKPTRIMARRQALEKMKHADSNKEWLDAYLDLKALQ